MPFSLFSRSSLPLTLLNRLFVFTLYVCVCLLIRVLSFGYSIVLSTPPPPSLLFALPSSDSTVLLFPQASRALFATACVSLCLCQPIHKTTRTLQNYHSNPKRAAQFLVERVFMCVPASTERANFHVISRIKVVIQ